jgi:hypothetical protein
MLLHLGPEIRHFDFLAVRFGEFAYGFSMPSDLNDLAIFQAASDFRERFLKLP